MALEVSSTRRPPRTGSTPPFALAKKERAACDIRVTETSLRLSGVIAFDAVGAA
jgi:hypothetical protein